MAYKHDYDKILTRLTLILSRLNDGEALSVKELALEFNVSERTIQRDFNERLVTFPIYQENKKWKMQDGHRIEKTRSLEDAIVLGIIEKITEGIGGMFSSRAYRLLSRIKNDTFNPIYTKLIIEDISDRLHEIQIFESAIQHRREVRCAYDDERHAVYTTTIQPLKIVNFEGFWYLIAMRKGVLKKYYLKNISDPVVTDEHFQTDPTLDRRLEDAISVWFQEDTEPFEVRIFVAAEAARFFKRRPLPTQTIEGIDTDGSMEITVRITHEMEILPIIKYWIPHLKVLEPRWIDEIIDRDLEVYRSDYSS